MWWSIPLDGNRMGGKVPILWEIYEYQFPRFSLYDGFCYILPYHGKLMWKPMHFLHSDIGSFFLWLRVNMYYFHTCVYINPILLWQSLSSRCVVDHLWNLHYALCFAFWAHFFHVQCATVQVYGLPQSHCDDNRNEIVFMILYLSTPIYLDSYCRQHEEFLLLKITDAFMNF